MAKHINLRSYDDVENLSNFSEDSFVSYCKEKLSSCSDHLKFISRNCVVQSSPWGGKVCEVGSGNSKLLYRLERENLLSEGVGIEISHSRFRFAEKFKEFVNSTKVKNLNSNVLEMKPFENFDLIMAVDIVFQLISPVDDLAEEVFLKWARKSLKSTGFLVLELWDLDNIKRQLELFQNNLKIWEEFPSSDPWEFVLAEITADSNKDIVWKKMFLKRGAAERSSFINILRPYSKAEITEILLKAGFAHVQIFDYWELPSRMQQGEFIVVATPSGEHVPNASS